MSRLIFHIDVNSAYLSWEAARRVAAGEADLRLIPSAIGGDREKRTGVILGTPNYLGDVSAGFRALYERLIFQSLSYKLEPRSYNRRQIPVLMIMTSNASEEFYPQIGYDEMLKRYQNTLGAFVGPTKILISSDTLQVRDYSRYNWTMFNPEAKKTHHEEVFPLDKQKAFQMGAELI